MKGTEVDFLLEEVFNVPKNISIRIKSILNYIKEGQLEEVIDEFKTIVDSQPDWAQLHYNIIVFLVLQGHFPTLQIAFNGALKKESKNAILHYGIGLISQTQNKQDEAIKAYQKATELNPNFAAAYFCQATAYQTKGQRDAVIEACKEAIRRSPRIAEPHYGLGVAFMNKKEMGKAFYHFKKFLSLAPPYLSNYISDAKKSIQLLAGKLP